MEIVSPDLIEHRVLVGAAPARIITGTSLIIRKTAYDSEADMKALAAVDTGFMRNSISTFAAGLYAEVGPTADYSIFVEDGTSTQAPQPFVRPAAERNVPLMEHATAQLLGSLL